MSFAADLRTFLASLAAVTELVGERIERNKAGQQTTFPRIVYSLLNRRGFDDLRGAGNVSDQTWQIDCQGITASSASDVAGAVQTALNGYLGAMGGTGRVAATLANVIDEYDPPTDGGALGVHRVILDFSLLVHA